MNGNKKILSQLTVNDILKVYSGKHGCMCGCNGKYYVNPDHRAEADKARGYAYDDEDMSMRMVKRVLKLMNEFPRVDMPERGTYDWFSMPEDTERNYTIYLTEEAKKRLKALNG